MQRGEPGLKFDCSFDWTRGRLAEGLQQYGAGQFFAAHESWESVWLAAPEPEKTFLQGLIQVTAAFHHLQRGNPEGASRLLRAALRRLENYPECFGGLSVALLLSDIRERLEALEAGAPVHPLRSCRIQPRPLGGGSVGRNSTLRD